MVARTLITTADERTWPKDKSEPVLFLGEWCLRYSRKQSWEKLDYKVAPFHWDDRAKLFKDYQWIQEIYETMLLELSDKLNQVHSVQYSHRYWRILIGPWLGYFIQILFDRWYMLVETINNNDITSCCVIKRDSISIVPNDMKHFTQLMVEDDWNEAVYGQLLSCHIKKSCNIDSVQIQTNIKCNGSADKKQKNKRETKESIINLFNRFFPIKQDGYFYIASCLPVIKCFKLQIRLGQFPKLWREKSVPVVSPNKSERQWCLGVDSVEINSFEYIVRKLISQHIPTAYLEGYKNLLSTLDSLLWPRHPKLIFTSNSYSGNDVFKAWAASKCDSGALLVIGQHGGHFGMTPFAFHEEHQIEIADKWLSWGWLDAKRPQIKAIGNFKISKRNASYNSKGGALMVVMATPRYSYHLYAAPISKQNIDYLNDQFSFVDHLPELIRVDLVVRLYHRDYGWDLKERWRAEYPNINIDNGVDNLNRLIANCRIYITTYNATTYLESFAMNVPTIMFWNPNHWELLDSVKPYFSALENAGVFHKTPESAAKHLAKIWDNVDSWWKSEPVVQAVGGFCNKFNKIDGNTVDAIYQECSSICS